MLHKASNVLLVTLSGLLLAASWFTPFTLFIFVGFAPLFLMTKNIHETHEKKRGLKIWALSYLAFFIWNIITTWWVYKASFGGAVLAIVCNALLMSWAFLIWYRVERKIYGTLKFWLFIPLWLAFEYGHMQWDLTWPWLTVGNCFANTTSLVQWYESTGISGGTLWVLVVNVLLAKIAISDYKQIKAYVKPLLVIILPVLISLLILSLRSFDRVKTINTTIIQPNIDPYNTKFSTEFNQQLNTLHQQLSQLKLNRNTQLVVLPETFISDNVHENNYQSSQVINNLKTLIKIHFPKAAIVTGASSYREFSSGEKIPETARKYDNADVYYDMYNTAIYIDTLGNTTFYHKSKLVPGVERMPFPGIFKYFEKYAIDMGGTTGSLGTQSERTVFNDEVLGIKLAPAVCYESIYSDFMADYIRAGADLICVITNDGWWDNTPGHRQHLSYAKLRVIETRKQVVRSANTGISCFIDEFGNISQPLPYWEFGVINQDVAINSARTIFVRFGDIISYASVFLTVLILLYSQYLRFRSPQKLVNS